MKRHHATECTYQIDESWVDHTRYVYAAGPILALAERFGPARNAASAIEAALKRFQTSAPGHQLLERREVSAPTLGAVQVFHRVAGPPRFFEAAVFWPLGEDLWLFRAHGPWEQETACREALQSFIHSYTPIEEA
jgi:hypothetical protein